MSIAVDAGSPAKVTTAVLPTRRLRMRTRSHHDTPMRRRARKTNRHSKLGNAAATSKEGDPALGGHAWTR